MICARGKGKPRILKLTLRCGARKRVWAPLVLHWRRRATIRAIRSDRGSSCLQQLFLTQNHFHFVTLTNSSERRYSQFAIFPTATIYRERLVFDRRSTNTTVHGMSNERRAHRPSSPVDFVPVSMFRERIVFDRKQTNVTVHRVSKPQRAQRRSLSNYVFGRALPGLIVERSESLTRFQSVYLSRPVQRHQRRSSVRDVTRVDTRREELTQIFKTHSRTRDYQTRIFTLRTPASFLPAGSSQKKSTRILVDTSEELVWRRKASVINNEIGDGKTITPTLREQVRTAVNETPAQTVSPSLNRPTPLRITQLDPALVDRLTDDVIRRVEQRARIERQRRGL